ncbi:eight-cysteine-cluster domain-containing protein [Candidatus Gracilibacteria bacterium]|nr:eight-cysteine-cluster domain-containing protein [Candidatus Gracilibacteria bacterium]
MIKNKKKYFIVGIVFIVIVTTLYLPQCSRILGELGGFCGYSTGEYCENNNDCTRSGCSGEVCQSKSSLGGGTICEARECYDWKKYNLECGCVNNKCQWSK